MAGNWYPILTSKIIPITPIAGDILVCESANVWAKLSSFATAPETGEKKVLAYDGDDGFEWVNALGDVLRAPTAPENWAEDDFVILSDEDGNGIMTTPLLSVNRATGGGGCLSLGGSNTEPDTPVSGDILYVHASRTLQVYLENQA